MDAIRAELAKIIRLGLIAAGAGLGYDGLTSEGATAAAQVAAGLLIALGGYLWSKWHDRRLKVRGTPRSHPLSAAANLLAVAGGCSLLMVGLTGCTATPLQAGANSGSTLADTATAAGRGTYAATYADGEVYTVTADTPTGRTIAGRAGIDKTALAPSSTASVDDSGLAADIAQDGAADSVKWRRPRFGQVTEDDGTTRYVLAWEEFEGQGLSISGSAVIDAQARYITANLPAAIEAYRQGSTTYTGYIDGQRALYGAWADALDTAARAAVSLATGGLTEVVP